MKKAYGIIVFFIVVVLAALYYNYHEIAFKRPQSIHKWRQSDCASIALNYYQHGMDFFHPETHNLTSEGGKSGKCCTSEIPVLYYTVAVLYKIFGYHDSVFRIFNMLIFFLGLFYLFRIFRYLIKDVFWSLALSLLFFTSPVLVYYGNNFLSNSSSLSFSIVGWYYFIRFAFDRKPRYFYISMLFYLLAASCKLTALFSLFAIAGIYLLELFRGIAFGGDRKLFERKAKYALAMLPVFVIVGAWLVYAHLYNKQYDCSYFSTTIFPIWDLTKAQIADVVNKVLHIWQPQYFHSSVLAFLAMCFLFVFYYFRRNHKVLMYSIMIIAAEVFVYVILQFWTFGDHDYYTIDMYILPMIVVISAFDVLRRNFNGVLNSGFVKISFSVFILFNVYHAHKQMNERYNGWMNDVAQNADLYTITPYLREIGISENDTVISIPDNSHCSLYLMNQKGWTEYTDMKFNRGEKLRYNQDSSGIQASIDKGAKYLIVNGESELYTKPYLLYYCHTPVGRYNNVLIFDLRGGSKGLSLNKRNEKTRVMCNAELLSPDRQFFVCDSSDIRFEYGISQSSDLAFTGKYAAKLNAACPYGMTLSFDSLQHGESFRISVWRKPAPGSKQGDIIVAGVENPFYYNQYEIVDRQKGWEKLAMEFFVSPEMNNKSVKVYLYNPGNDAVYFDDFEVVRYHSVFE